MLCFWLIAYAQCLMGTVKPKHLRICSCGQMLFFEVVGLWLIAYAQCLMETVKPEDLRICSSGQMLLFEVEPSMDSPNCVTYGCVWAQIEGSEGGRQKHISTHCAPRSRIARFLPNELREALHHGMRMDTSSMSQA